MITGATSGIGLAAACALARRGAELVLLCRDARRGKAAAARIAAQAGTHASVDVLQADLASQADIRRAAAEFIASRRPLHVLLNNAGVVMLKRTETVDGIETTLAVNHLAYFLLTNLLLEPLRRSAPSRIVCVASDAHRMAGGPLDLDDLEGRQRYAAMRNYGMSKLANILFTREMARRLGGTAVTINCLHPGMVSTGLGANNGLFARALITLLRPFSRSPDRGAATSVFLCSEASMAGVSGKYFANCREARPNDAALDDEAARQLWQISARMTGLPPV